MNNTESSLARLLNRIKQNPIIASLLTLAALITALSSFTGAAKSLLDLIPANRPAISGTWIADIHYPALNKNYSEKFIFNDTGDTIMGTASFLGVNRAISQSQLQNNTISFISKTQQWLGNDNTQELIHRYSGVIEDNKIKFSLQNEGGFSEQTPIEFIAIKQP